MNCWIRFTSLLIFMLVIPGCGNTPAENNLSAKTVTYCTDPYFNNAFIEIKAMLDGQIPLNFKRAVFLSEYAYCSDEINYEEFNHEIEETAEKLREFTRQRKIDQYKTAGNFAIFEYMTKSSGLNDHQHFTYDFDDFYGEKDWRSTFVTKLVRTKRGNCRSLPYYYKILANELGVNAHLAFAPNHVYIKHKGEDDQWINVELTSGGFPRDEFIIQSMGITERAIETWIYMYPITERQSIAACLFDMVQGYVIKYGEDDFALLCCNTILKYHPHNIQTILLKNNILVTTGNQLKKSDGKNPSVELKEHHKEYLRNLQLINDLGYREMTKEEYSEWMQEVEQEKKKQMNLTH